MLGGDNKVERWPHIGCVRMKDFAESLSPVAIERKREG